MRRDSTTSEFMAAMIVAQVTVLSICGTMFGVLLWVLK